MTNQDDLFHRYINVLRARHEQGRKEYGDRSMERGNVELLTEMQEELADVTGWAFFLWAKLERLKERADG